MVRTRWLDHAGVDFAGHNVGGLVHCGNCKAASRDDRGVPSGFQVAVLLVNCVYSGMFERFSRFSVAFLALALHFGAAFGRFWEL